LTYHPVLIDLWRNILTGTTKDEIFVAGAGNDILTGNGGMDVLNAGTGDDTIIINASNIAALEKTGAGNRAPSPLLPNTLRILALVEVCNKSSKLNFRVLLPEPVISITSMSWMRLSLILVRSRVKPAPSSLV
jgi:hypothetical protein